LLSWQVPVPLKAGADYGCRPGSKKSRCAVFKGGASSRGLPLFIPGLEEEGLKLLKEAKEATGLLIITEVTSERAIEIADSYVDMFQVGARNVQNFQLLREIGRSKKPVLLKRVFNHYRRMVECG